MPLVAVMMVFGVIMAVPVPACPAGAVFAVVMRFCAVTAVSTVCVCFVVAMLIPVVVAVLFTLLHALIQAYVLTTLTSMFYGETTEKHAPKPKKTKKVKAETVNN